MSRGAALPIDLPLTDIRGLLDGRKTAITFTRGLVEVPDGWQSLFYVREPFKLTVYAADGGMAFANFLVPDSVGSATRRYASRAFRWHRRLRVNAEGATHRRPACRMPREASRITLEMTGGTVGRLQDVPVDTAIAEGLYRFSKDGGRTWKFGIPDATDGRPGTDCGGWAWRDWRRDPREAYAHLIDQRYGAGTWDANPATLFANFDVHRENVDDLLRRRARERAA